MPSTAATSPLPPTRPLDFANDVRTLSIANSSSDSYGQDEGTENTDDEGTDDGSDDETASDTTEDS